MKLRPNDEVKIQVSFIRLVFFTDDSWRNRRMKWYHCNVDIALKVALQINETEMEYIVMNRPETAVI